MAANALQTTNYTTAQVMEGLQQNSTNTQINQILQNITFTATAASTTTLTNATTFVQAFTGTTTQTVYLPNATTLYTKYAITVINQSTGNVTVDLNDTSTNLATLTTGDIYTFVCTNIGTTNGTWSTIINNQGTLAVTVKSSWTPADASGATLSFSGVNAKYSQISNIIRFFVTLTYPSTASTASAEISGLPSAAAYGETCVGYTSNGILVQAQFSSSTLILTDAQGNSLQNVQLTGATITLSGSYQV